MKIAFLSFYSGVIYRGVETYVHELANRLVHFGNEVTVYQMGEKLPGSDYKTVTIKTEIDFNRKNSYVPFVNYYGKRVLEFTRQALREIDNQTDIIFPTNGQWQSLLCSLWAKRHSKKIVISGQSGPGLDDKINIWTFPERFVCLTEHQKKWAKENNPFVKSDKIPNGVDLTKFKLGKANLFSKLPKPHIICAAALDYWKRQDLAISAVSKLEKGSLILVGKGPEEKNLKSLGQKILPGRFVIVSSKHEEMPDLYKSADLATFPTVPWESFGIVLVEAMACGLPVVATDDPIRREIVGDAGLFVDPTDIDAYAIALQKAIETNWGDKPRKQAEKFDWDKIAKKYEELFNSL